MSQPVRLGASLHQPDGILSKLSHWLHCLGDLIHCNLILCVICIKMQNYLENAHFVISLVSLVLLSHLTQCSCSMFVCCCPASSHNLQLYTVPSQPAQNYRIRKEQTCFRCVTLGNSQQIKQYQIISKERIMINPVAFLHRHYLMLA